MTITPWLHHFVTPLFTSRCYLSTFTAPQQFLSKKNIRRDRASLQKYLRTSIIGIIFENVLVWDIIEKLKCRDVCEILCGENCALYAYSLEILNPSGTYRLLSWLNFNIQTWLHTSRLTYDIKAKVCVWIYGYLLIFHAKITMKLDNYLTSTSESHIGYAKNYKDIVCMSQNISYISGKIFSLFYVLDKQENK